MPPRYDVVLRLEPHPWRRSLTAGFAAPVADPVWFLARQWQMGEHQGENASTPVLVTSEAAHTPLLPAAGDARFDPTTVPAEAIVEAEPDDWWTMGRRLRLGPVLAARAGLALPGADPKYLLAAPPPPYERLAGAFDGLALWRDRALLDPDGTRFAGLGIPARKPFFWDPAELVYGAAFPLQDQQGARVLQLPRHGGGRVDWFSADSRADAGAPAFAPSGEVAPLLAYPTALQYPGAPRSRWWEIEDAAVDVGGYPPDTSHFATTLLIDLIASHGDDWFLFPVDARVGHVLSLRPVTVTDAFGDTYPLQAPTDWWLFQTTGLDRDSLVVWLRALAPVEGQPLEDVLLGLDEYSNLLWGVERRVDGRDLSPPVRAPDQEAANPTKAPPSRREAPEDVARFVYVPGRDGAPFWHPYQVEALPGEDGQPRRRFVQRRLADLARERPELLPAARAQVLRVQADPGDPASPETVHEIEPATVPSIGIVVQRRYVLARDTSGNPVLWLQRHRTPFLSPPGRTLRFDVLAEDVP
jgi:hypothetical protein